MTVDISRKRHGKDVQKIWRQTRALTKMMMRELGALFTRLLVETMKVDPTQGKGSDHLAV